VEATLYVKYLMGLLLGIGSLRVCIHKLKVIQFLRGSPFFPHREGRKPSGDVIPISHCVQRRVIIKMICIRIKFLNAFKLFLENQKLRLGFKSDTLFFSFYSNKASTPLKLDPMRQHPTAVGITETPL